MKNICTIIQPHYLPYKGYFDLFERSDKIIILDDVQFVKREWKNRNKIRKGPIENSYKWLTVPIDKKDQKKKIFEVNISEESNDWRDYHINSIIFSYKKTLNFKKFSELFFEIISDKKIKTLMEINMQLINLVCKILKIKKKIYFSSELKLKETGVNRLIKICEIHKCKNYLANNKTVENYGVKDFEDHNIKIIKQNYSENIYIQKYNGKNLDWIGNLSVLDYIFNYEKI